MVVNSVEGRARIYDKKDDGDDVRSNLLIGVS